nr:retrovirus-related Pol polyprotein from transposon TNT 1-94 [Tanacetum cinerariifolium]
MMSEKKVNSKPVDYAALNQLFKDFETRFVPQTELSAKPAFWSWYSVNSEERNLSSSTTIVEVPKELPKVSMVNSSLKKLKFHLASFDVDSSVALTAFADADHASAKILVAVHLVENGVIKLYFINTEYQLTDLFTKALSRDRIEFIINKLGMRSFTPETLKQLTDEVDE